MTMHFRELPQLWLQWCGQIKASPESCTADNTIYLYCMDIRIIISFLRVQIDLEDANYHFSLERGV